MSKTAVVPRSVLFETIQTMLKAEAALEAVDNAVRGMELPQGALKDTKLGKALAQLRVTRAALEELSILAAPASIEVQANLLSAAKGIIKRFAPHWRGWKGAETEMRDLEAAVAQAKGKGHG